ncbi:hypothetical protein GCM10020331_023560 [Ectobacillus funiculus]
MFLHKDYYYKAMEFLKYNEQLAFNYVSELHATDFCDAYGSVYSLVFLQQSAVSCRQGKGGPR